MGRSCKCFCTDLTFNCLKLLRKTQQAISKALQDICRQKVTRIFTRRMFDSSGQDKYAIFSFAQIGKYVRLLIISGDLAVKDDQSE